MDLIFAAVTYPVHSAYDAPHLLDVVGMNVHQCNLTDNSDFLCHTHLYYPLSNMSTLISR